jgi:O-antigen chain-terminating methyltransferase
MNEPNVGEQGKSSEEGAATAAEGVVPDIRTLMQSIREDVLSTIDARSERGIPDAAQGSVNFQRPSQNKGNTTQAGELVHSEDLRWLNQNYTPGLTLDLSKLHSHRPGLFAKLILKLKAKVLITVWDYLFKDLLENLRDYRAAQARFLNRTARYVDERDGSLFWELIHKLDYDNSQVSERVERIADEMQGELRQVQTDLLRELHSLRDRHTNLEQRIGSQTETQSRELHKLSEVVQGMESILHRYSLASSGQAAAASAVDTADREVPLPKLDYLLLENRFRGSEAEISERLQQYHKYLENLPGKVMEIGPGRGEFLEHCRSAGVEAFGVDLDQAMVDRCAEKGLSVVKSDGIAVLEQQQAGSLGAIFAFQVVEHLQAEQIEQLIAAAHEALAPGGVLLFETINPLSLQALSSNYFRDPTHVAPQHPETLRYLLERAGFTHAEIVFRAPIPESEQLLPLPMQDYMTPKWAQFLQQYNRNVDKLNNLLYGAQDFSIAAYKPALEQERFTANG